MLANYHIHTTFCDGEHTPEEMVLYAIENGFDAVGFSSHGYTEFDLRYCMRDTEGYIANINLLKQKYKGKIQIYLGVEEDAFSPVDRNKFDYVIGSSHYFFVGGEYYPIDSDYNYFKRCLEAFQGDKMQLAESYFRTFVAYIKTRKPDIIGHFDLITKYDEKEEMCFLNDEEYFSLANKYIKEIAETDCILEVNTGAMIKGLRTMPYPHERLLYTYHKCGGKVILSSDSHSRENMDRYFEETKEMLRNVGFRCVYVIDDGKFKKEEI